MELGPMRSETFIDWLDIHQTHRDGAELPIVSGGVVEETPGNKVAIVNCGEQLRYSVPSLQHRGSHDTSLRVRCDGQSVSMSGNVGRFGRPDNLFNHDFAETIDKASHILSDLGLPAFTPGQEFCRDTLSPHDQDIVERSGGAVDLWTQYTGAVVREMHVTRNFLTGSDAMAIEVMKQWRGLRAARLSKANFGTETLVFGGTGKKLNKRIVIYRKAAEMLAHARGQEAKEAVKASEAYQYALENGVVRVECKWGKDFLRDHALRFVGGITMKKVISLFEAQTAFLDDISPDRAQRLVSDMPAKLRAAALLWIEGKDLASLYPKTTFYRLVKRLRDECGIDAREPRSTLLADGSDELQHHLDNIKPFELRRAAVPEWYGLPEVEPIERAA